jgi:hypothetical protein
MHETARHAIHSSETLSVSKEIMEAMRQQVISLSTKDKRGGPEHAEACHQIRVHLDSQMQMLRNLFLRSQSNKERLQNEIALVRVGTVATPGASADIIAGVQLDRTARQSSNERPRRSGEG